MTLRQDFLAFTADAATSPDAVLLAHCRRHADMVAAYPAPPGTACGAPETDRFEAALAEAAEQAAKVLDQIAGIRAHTTAGQRAKARALLAYDEGEHFGPEPSGLTDRLTASLIQDVLGEAGA